MKKLCFVILFIFVSCKYNGNFENLITDDNKRWVFYYKHPDSLNKEDKSTYFFNTFLKNSTIKTYVFINGKENMTYNFESQNSKMDKWKYNESDSTLSMFGNNYKVLRYDSDTIIVKKIKSNTNQFLINRNPSK